MTDKDLENQLHADLQKLGAQISWYVHEFKCRGHCVDDLHEKDFWEIIKKYRVLSKKHTDIWQANRKFVRQDA